LLTGVLREELQPMPDTTNLKEREVAHWAKTSRLMFTHLGIWFFFGFIIHMFVVPLNKITIPILGFPLGFYMAAQGSLIVFVVMLFVFAKQQDKIDREFDFAEDD
jgi:putative solute:sodium symporter small subunit